MKLVLTKLGILILCLGFIPVLHYAQIKVYEAGVDAKVLNRYNNLNTYVNEGIRRAIIEENLSIIRSMKIKNSKMSGIRSASKFKWPLKPSEGFNDFGYYAIINFVDHNPGFPNQLLDYNGGERSYDLGSGYNHTGTDIIPWPFPWLKMEDNVVEVISMAEGIILDKIDGHFDKSCSLSSLPWNAVYILHDNGLIAWYGHLKKGSLTTKSAGDSVRTGDYLGLIGSSGSSTAPHLHLEIHDSEGNIIDPWEGPYNETITSSLWESQKPYYDPQINKLSSHNRFPEFPECPGTELMYTKEKYIPGDTVYLFTHYRDVMKDDTTSYKIIQPDSTIWASWDHKWELGFYSAAFWGWYIIVPEDAKEGNWTYSVTYHDSTYQHQFYIENNMTFADNSFNEPTQFNISQNYPNPFNSETSIAFELNIPSYIRIRLVDILGREVRLLSDGYKNYGNYKITLEASDLASGIYVCEFSSISVKTNKAYLKSIKMSLLK